MNERILIAALWLASACASPDGPAAKREPTTRPACEPARSGADAEEAPKPASFASRLSTRSPEAERSIARGLSWEEARARVLSDNPDIAIARARIARARAAIETARSADAWHLGVNVEALAADAPSSYLFKTIDARGLEPGTDFNDPGSFGAVELGLDLLWNLYDGGGTASRIRAAQAHSRAAEVEERIVQEALLRTLADVWIAVLSAEEHISSAQVSVRTVEAQLKEVRARFESGRALRSDILSLEVRLAEAREVEIRSRSARRLALAAFAQLIGFEPTELTGEGPPTTDLPSDLEAALQVASQDRPELELVRHRIEASTAALEGARASRAPRADLLARVWRDETDGGFDDPEQNWLVGLRLGLPLIDGGRTSAAIKEARAARVEARLNADRLWRDIQHEVRSAWLRLAEAQTRLQVADTAVEQARESLELVRRQYEAGSAAITRYMEAELMWTQARRRKADAAFDIRRAQFAAAHSLGWSTHLTRKP